jgi:glycosyltransferase involved in cell wall biosynthesis
MNTNAVENKRPGLSVVMATLGGSWIEKTIDSLVQNSVVPDEILICIPKEHSHKVAHLANDTVKIIATDTKGQVRQRAVGFSKVSFELVMQLDDDILLEKDSINRLIQYIRQLGKGNVIGPVYYGKNTGKCIHEIKLGASALSKNLFDSIICAAPWGIKKMGVVTSLGINYGVDDQYCRSELMQTQWLPGGCVLSFREDLIVNDFFPFTGKAYCEDLIHSYYRMTAKKVSWVATGLRVCIDEPIPEFSREAVEKVIEIRRYYLKLTGVRRWRLFLYESFSRIRSKLYHIKKRK